MYIVKPAPTASTGAFRSRPKYDRAVWFIVRLAPVMWTELTVYRGRQVNRPTFIFLWHVGAVLVPEKALNFHG